VHTILARQAASEADFWDDLSDAQRTDIEAGLADLDAGRKKDFKDVMGK
jgi:predicted transcriptional regulator